MSASAAPYSVGDELDPLVIGEITKELIAEYSRVSHDPNPMHTDEELARLHAPIGLPLGGRAPAEIAMSIMAEILQAKNSVLTREVTAAAST